MTDERHPRVRCIACGKDRAPTSSVPVPMLRQALAQYIAEQHPTTWDPEGYICHACLDTHRVSHLVAELERERGDLSQLEAEVTARAAKHSARAEHIGDMFVQQLTLGQKVADSVARVGGSWPFVIGFGVVLASWVVVNSTILGKAFDPYPYILLNLVLSCLAAIQAPIIMMSQNRFSARDRLQADEDFKVNLKAELEIGLLHAKVDHLLHVQWERMVALQQAQLEVLEELTEARASRRPASS